MDWLNNLTAACLSAFLWHIPEPNYWQIWCEHTMRSDVLPLTPGW